MTVQGNTPAVMAAEIKFAAEFGIDFWAFCAYPVGCADYNPPSGNCPKIQCCADNYVLSYALNLYLTSPVRDQVWPHSRTQSRTQDQLQLGLHPLCSIVALVPVSHPSVSVVVRKLRIFTRRPTPHNCTPLDAP